MADSGLRNYDKAVEDLEFLLSEFKEDEFDSSDPRGFPFAVTYDGILRRRIIYLLLSGDAKAANGAALAFLETHEDDQIALDLAGRAVQILYQKNRRDLLDKSLNLRLSERQRKKLNTALLPWLYETPDSPSDSKNYEVLVDVLNKALDPLTANEILQNCRELRADIRTSATFFSRALRGPDAVAGSLAGYAEILMKAGDHDSAGALSWLYLLRFRGPEAAVAARICMEAHLLQGNPALAAQAGRTWLERDQPNQPKEPKPPKLGASGFLKTEIGQGKNTATAFLYFALALFRQGRGSELTEFAQSLLPLLENQGHRMAPSYFWSRGLDLFLAKDFVGCEDHLSNFCTDPRSFFPTKSGLDLFETAMRVRVDAAMAEKKHGLAHQILKEWILRRPDEVGPRLELSTLMIQDLGLYRLASKECERILTMPREGMSHEDALNLLLLAQDSLLSKNGMDSQSLLRDLIQNKTPTHIDLPHPILRYGIAFLASQIRNDPIFEANIEQFLEDYPESSNGRCLLAQHYMRKGRIERALYETNSILDRNPDHLLAAHIHRQALLAAKAPLVTQLAFDRNFLDRFSSRPEAAEIMGELLLARNADREALLVSSQSLGASQRPQGLMWIRARAHLALGEYPVAVEDLLSLDKDSKHRKDALLKALQTSLEQDLKEGVQAIVQRMLAEEIPASTLVRAAELCAARGLQSTVLDLLEPIYVESGEDAKEARNGSFFTLRARAFLANGKTKEARDMLRRAVSFDDGGEAGAYLILTSLFSGREDEAREMLGHLGTLEGLPLTLLILDVKLGNFSAARKRLEAAHLAGNYVQKVLLLALDSLEGKKKVDPGKGTGVTELDSFARGHAERILEALCFAPDMAFRARSDEALTSLQAWVSEGENAKGEDFLVQLTVAWRAELLGQRIEARERLGALLLPSSQTKELLPFFLLTHREFLRLAGKDYNFLTNLELTSYFVGLVHQLGAENLVDLGITQLALLGQGRVHIATNQMNKTLELFEAAKVLAQTDLPILDMLAQAQELTGKLSLAIETRLQRYSLLNGLEKTRELQKILVLRERIQQANDLENPDHKKILERLQNVIYDYLEADASPTHPPLGRATLIEIRAKWDSRPEIVGQLLDRCFTPYTNGELAPGLDPQGLAQILRFLFEKRHAKAMEWLEQLLLRDPSLVGLRILEAQEKSLRGQERDAVAALQHLENLLPSEQTSRALASLRARTGLGSAAQKQALLTRLEKNYPEITKVEQALLQFRLGNPAACLQTVTALQSQDLPVSDQTLIDLASLYAERADEYEAIRERMTRPATRAQLEVAQEIAAQLLYMVPQDAKAGR